MAGVTKHGRRVRFYSTVDLVNALEREKAQGRAGRVADSLLRMDLVILDELGYLPIDKSAADLLFQVISQRYEQGSILLTTNQPYKHWPKIFNNDSTLTSAVLDRLLHHAETVIVEGKSYRMKDQIETP